MKKRKTASAIGYKSGEIAPKLLASGKGREAELIINIANEAGIAVVEDAALASLLEARANPGDFIPPLCWEAAAKVLAFVSKTEQNNY